MKAVTLTIIAIVSLTSCNTKDKMIDNKNNCYEKRLATLKTKEIYKRVLTSFTDTLKIVQLTNKSFLEERADESVFFKNDSLECLTLVLERDNDKNGLFGSVRVWDGKLVNGKWTWSKSMTFDFSNDYFEKYENNTFDNISVLARYSVLTSGEAKLSDCDLDDYYWFTYLKD